MSGSPRPSDDASDRSDLVRVEGSSYPPGFRAARGRNWFMLGLTYASYYLCRYNLDPVAPELMRDMNLTKADYGLIKTGRDACYGVGQMVNGLFTDRIGGKRAMTIGAVGTIVLNLAFALSLWSQVAWVFPLLVVIRAADGYFQAFGAPGFIKINTAWFRRKERGAFAGIFGAMINLGQIGANQFARLLATGFVLPLVITSIAVPKMDWHYMFVVPPIVLAVVVVVMNLIVRNTPEESGFAVQHDDEPGGDVNERVRLRDVLRKIASNKTVWIIAGAYFCTGFVRSALVSWWAVYLLEVWHSDRTSPLFGAMAWGLPITATVGAMSSGYVSDRFFAGRRAPVAMAVYFLEGIIMLIALTLSSQGPLSTSTIAVVLLLAISTFCNSTHSILGSAAAMDLGGRKMAGCASGIINSFQYYGAMLSGWGIGFMFVYFRDAGVDAKAAPFVPAIWFGSMLPFSALGTCLMGYLWLKNRGKNTLGA